MAKIQHGVKPDICKRAAQKWPKILGWCKNFNILGHLFGPKMCFKQLKKWVGPQLTKKSGGVKHGYLQEGAPKKKSPNSIWAKPDELEKPCMISVKQLNVLHPIKDSFLLSST